MIALKVKIDLLKFYVSDFIVFVEITDEFLFRPNFLHKTCFWVMFSFVALMVLNGLSVA